MIAFKRIGDSQGLKKLKQLPNLNNVKDLHFSVIFNQVEIELSQVSLDLYEIWQKIQIDINNELIQSQELNDKLIHVYKHLYKTYSRLSKLRQKNAKYNYQSKKMDKIIQILNETNNNLENIEKIHKEVLEYVVKISDSRFISTIKKSNKYPKLIKLINNSYPEIKGNYKQENILEHKTLKSPFLKNSKASTFITKNDIMSNDH